MLAWQPAARAATVPDAQELAVQADVMDYDDVHQVFNARGHVVVDRPDLHVEAAAMHVDLRTRHGALEGPIHVTGGGFDLMAASATFDLAANQASLLKFTGHWGSRAQFAGEQLDLGPRIFKLQSAWITSCMAPRPDLQLAARNFRYFPQGERMDLAGDGVALRVWDHDLITLPHFNATLKAHPEHTSNFDALGLFPAFGFDIYRGFLTGTRLDFSLGENSRGSVPIEFSTGRGLSGGIEHALDLGPGEVHNGIYLENPWADGRGGLRATNAYVWTTRNGGHLELDTDYRADLNGLAVHRLPDISYTFPSMRLAHFLHVQMEARAGYLWEESSGQQATRLRWAATCDTPIWTPLPGVHSWISASPFFNHYIFQPFGGFTSGWNNNQDWGHGLSTSQTVEFNRVYGQTPFIHDRQYDAERLRLGLNEDWFPALTTSAAASWSRINQMGDFSIEDVSISNTYRWYCFGFSLVLHPIVWGVDVHLAAGMF